MKKHATAITHQGTEFQIVALEKQGDLYEIRLNGRQTEVEDWAGIMREYAGNSVRGVGVGHEVAIGYDSSRVAFYRLSLPPVKDEDLPVLLEHQAEALLPLPVEQMAMSWRKQGNHNGSMDVILTAARRDQLERFCRQLGETAGQRVYLESEALVIAAYQLCDIMDEEALIVYPGSRRTHICLVQNRRLVLSTYSDVKREVLGDESHLQESSAERLGQDIRNLAERYSPQFLSRRKVIIISDGSVLFDNLARNFQRSGLTSQAKPIRMELFANAGTISPGLVYEYFVTTGVALLAIEQAEGLDLFGQFWERKEEKPARIHKGPLIAGAALAMIAFGFFLYTSYRQDTAYLQRMNNTVAAATQDTTIEQLEKEFNTKKAIADYRIDLLKLITEVQACVPEGEMLDGIQFVRYQQVAVSGATKKRDNIFQFIENLQARKDFKNVDKTLKMTGDKQRPIGYTITFDYKNYTTKKK